MQNQNHTSRKNHGKDISQNWIQMKATSCPSREQIGRSAHVQTQRSAAERSERCLTCPTREQGRLEPCTTEETEEAKEEKEETEAVREAMEAMETTEASEVTPKAHIETQKQSANE